MLLPVIPLLLPRMRKRLLAQVRVQRRLRWRSRGPRRNVEGLRVRPRHGAARNRNPCEGSTRVPGYRFACSGTGLVSLFFYFYLFSFAAASSLCCIPPLPRTLYFRACSVIFQRTVMAFLELAVILPPFPLKNYFGNTFFLDGWFFVLAQVYTAIMSTNICTQIIDTLYF